MDRPESPKAAEPAQLDLLDEEDSATPTINGSNGVHVRVGRFFLFDLLGQTDFNIGLGAKRASRIGLRRYFFDMPQKHLKLRVKSVGKLQSKF